MGISGTVTRSRTRKTRNPFTAAADLLEYHPRTSMDRKLKLNSQGRGPRAQGPQKRGGGGGWRTSGFHSLPYSSRNRCGRWGGAKTLGCPAPLTRNPHRSPPLPWAVPAPARPAPRGNTLPRPDSRVPSPQRTQSTPLPHPPKSPGSREAPDQAGPNFPTPRQPPLRLPLPPRKVDENRLLAEPRRPLQTPRATTPQPPEGGKGGESAGGRNRRANRSTPTIQTGIPNQGETRAAEEGAEWSAPGRGANWRGRGEGARRPRPPGCTHLSAVGRALHSHLLPRVRQLRQRHLPPRPAAFTASSLPARPAAGPAPSPPEPHGSSGGSSCSSSGGCPGEGSAPTPTLERRAPGWRRPRAEREPRAAAGHRVLPLSSSPASAAGTTAPPPRRFPRPLPAEQQPPRAPLLPLTTWRLSDTCLSERGSAAAATAARTRGRGLGRHAPGRGAPLVPPSSPQPLLLGLAFFLEGRAGEIWGRRLEVGERGKREEVRKAGSF